MVMTIREKTMTSFCSYSMPQEPHTIINDLSTLKNGERYLICPIFHNFTPYSHI